MAALFQECGDIVMTKDLKEAVLLISKEAKSGDTVLFSPACSSFDMFKDYEERGEAFINLVKSL